MSLSGNIKSFRLEKNLTQEQLAAKLGNIGTGGVQVGNK